MTTGGIAIRVEGLSKRYLPVQGAGPQFSVHGPVFLGGPRSAVYGLLSVGGLRSAVCGRPNYA